MEKNHRAVGWWPNDDSGEPRGRSAAAKGNGGRRKIRAEAAGWDGGATTRMRRG
ncbi:hypothetical protein ACFLXE_00275 [Chloroflexota bacterium]